MKEKDMYKFVGKCTTFSIKRLTCGVCKKEWFITETPVGRDHWFCTWCGVLQESKEAREDTLG